MYYEPVELVTSGLLMYFWTPGVASKCASTT